MSSKENFFKSPEDIMQIDAVQNEVDRLRKLGYKKGIVNIGNTRGLYSPGVMRVQVRDSKGRLSDV
jgi:hypothetical protein